MVFKDERKVKCKKALKSHFLILEDYQKDLGQVDIKKVKIN